MAQVRAHLEVEIKLEAPQDAMLPTAWPAGLAAEAYASYDMEATYYDTPERELAAQGIAVRLRRGGSDAGWHVKQRITAGTQYESLWPVSDSLPDKARELIEEHVAGAATRLQQVAQIRTRRTAITLNSVAGQPRYEIADDAVWTLDAATGTARAWREWEIEALSEADTAELEQLTEQLVAAGARPSLADSKIARAAGALLPRALARASSASRLAALAVQDLADRLQADTVLQTEHPGPAQNTQRITELREIACKLSDAASSLNV